MNPPSTRLCAWFLGTFVALHGVVVLMAMSAVEYMLHPTSQHSFFSTMILVSNVVFFAYIYTGYLFARAVTGSALLGALSVWLGCLPVVNYGWIGWLLVRFYRQQTQNAAASYPV